MKFIGEIVRKQEEKINSMKIIVAELLVIDMNKELNGHYDINISQWNKISQRERTKSLNNGDYIEIIGQIVDNGNENLEIEIENLQYLGKKFRKGLT